MEEYTQSEARHHAADVVLDILLNTLVT